MNRNVHVLHARPEECEEEGVPPTMTRIRLDPLSVPPTSGGTLGDITPVLVHDLKGPISAISMNVDFALDQLPEGEALDSVRSALLDCRQAGGRLFRMVANLLDVARAEAGELRPSREPVLLGPLVRAIASDFALEIATRRVRIELEAHDLPAMPSNADLVTRAVQCVVENALRHTRAGGRIRLALRAASDGVEIRIANDGAPIPPEEIPRLFRRNVVSRGSMNAERPSLGLYFCRLAMRALGGEIAIDAEPTYPVCFVLRLPR